MAIPCRLGELSGCLAILLEPVQSSQVSSSQSPQTPGLALRLAPTQRRTRSRRGAHAATELLPRHLRTIHGDGA